MSELSEHRDASRPSASLVPAAYRDLIDSERVGTRLREALLERAAPDDPGYAPRTLSEPQLWALRALLDRVVPQDANSAIDIAARLDRMMAEADGNGWRYEALPTDPDAYRIGLDTLEMLALDRFEQSFAALAADEQDDLLRKMASGDAGIDGRHDGFSAAQMKLWFEELRSDAVRQYVAHPVTLARLGYSGIANGGLSGAAFTGFDRVGIAETEDFEPRPSKTGAAE